MGAAIVRVVPRCYTTDRLPSPEVDISTGFLVKRTMIFAEVQEPSIYSTLFAHDEKIRSKLAKLFRYAEDSKIKVRDDAPLIKDYHRQGLELVRKIEKAESRARKIASGFEHSILSLQKSLPSKISMFASATGPDRTWRYKGGLIELQNDQAMILFGEFCIHKRRQQISYTSLSINKILNVTKDGVTVSSANNEFANAGLRTPSTPVSFLNEMGNSNINVLTQILNENFSILDILNRESKVAYGKALGKNYQGWKADLLAIDAKKLMIVSMSSLRKDRIIKINRIIKENKILLRK